MPSPWEQAQTACSTGDLPGLQEVIQQHDLISAQRIRQYDWSATQGPRPGGRDIVRHDRLLAVAARKGDAPIVRYLLGLSDRVSAVILVASMDSQSPETMQALIDASPAVIRSVGSHNMTCLDEALYFPPATALIATRVLLQNGYDPNFLHSAIPLAVYGSSPAVVEELVRYGAIPSPLEFLYTAATCPSTEMATYLLDAGAEIDRNQPYTALYAATMDNKVEMVRLLVQRGADRALPGYEGGPTPLEVATQKDFHEIVALLTHGSGEDAG